MTGSKALPMIIVVGPSGVGKSSFVDKITAEIPSIKDIVTYTTRTMRTGEVNGVHYHFVEESKFKALIEDSFFVEWANVHGKMYGTPKDQIQKTISTPGEAVIMDVDVQGAFVFQEKYPGCLTVFIHPPDMDILKQRVISREGKAPADLAIRMDNAKKEIAVSHKFDQQIVNNEFGPSYASFKKMIEDYLGSI